MDFAKLSSEDINALDGYHREAWYEFERGDAKRAAEIVALYEGKPKRAAKADATSEPAGD